jgi:hypothetical protein
MRCVFPRLPRRGLQFLVLAAALGTAVACERQVRPELSAERLPEPVASAVVDREANGRVLQAAVKEPFALVELFTSEGCSSCPPADRALSRLAERAEAGDHIVALSLHVDYWNYLGWSDPFSQQSFSARQRAYANEAFKGRVYTPQAVINGAVELVGSDEGLLDDAVQRALQTQPLVTVTLELVERRERVLTVRYQVAPEVSGRTLVLVLAQRHARRAVQSGENEGRTLEHVNVARRLEQRKLDSAAGAVELSLPEDLTLGDARLIAFVQGADWRVLGVQSLELVTE